MKHREHYKHPPECLRPTQSVMPHGYLDAVACEIKIPNHIMEWTKSWNKPGVVINNFEFQQGRFSNDETSNNADYVSQCYISTLISAYVGQSINTQL